MREDNFF